MTAQKAACLPAVNTFTQLGSRQRGNLGSPFVQVQVPRLSTLEGSKSMARSVRTFAVAEPKKAGSGQPKSNAFTFDLSGLDMTDEHLVQVRQEALRAAMKAAASLVKPGVMDDFGTFSTFSTFGTFGSGFVEVPFKP